jgi:hypothetical protein
LATFANDIGIAVRAGQVDAEHVRRYFGYYVKAYWVVLEPQITKYREMNDFPAVFSSFEYLYRLVTELDARKGLGPVSAPEADRFRKEEMVQAQYHLEANSGKFDL